jgi:hypothetical protein
MFSTPLYRVFLEPVKRTLTVSFWNSPNARPMNFSGTRPPLLRPRFLERRFGACLRHRGGDNDQKIMSVSIAEVRRLNMSNIRRSSGGRFVSMRRINRYNPLRFESSKYPEPSQRCEPSQHCKVTYLQRETATQQCTVTYSSCPSSPCIPESPPATPAVFIPDEFVPQWHMPDWFDEGSQGSPIEID